MTNMAGKLTLHDCVDRGDLDMLTRLLDDGWSVDRENKYGQTALYRSAELGNTNIVKVLISYGADVNVKDIIHGDTPLHKSAQSGNKDIVKLLIQHGADVDPVDWVDDTPLKLAELRGHGDIVDILKQAKRGQASDGRKWGFFQRIFGYSSSTKKISIQSSDGKGQVTKVKYEDKEVRSHVAGAVCTSETGRDETFGKVKVTRQKSSQGHNKQEPVTKSAGTSSSYLTTSAEVDVCTSPGLYSELKTSASPSVSAPLQVTSSSATSTKSLVKESLLTSTSSKVTASQTSALSLAVTASSQTPTSSSTITALASSQPAPNLIDEVTQCAHKLIRAVKDKKLSGSGKEYDGVYPDDNSFDVPREHMGGNVIVIDQKTENHYHNNYYTHCPNCTCTNKQTKCEEVSVETSESLNVSVGSTQYGLLYPPRGDDHDDDRETRREERDEGTVDVGMTGKSYTGIQTKTFTESTSLLSTTSTLSPATASTSTSTTTSTAADEIRRRLESQAGDLERMVQSCVTGGGVCQPQSSDLDLLHHGGLHVPVHLNLIYQPKHVEVWNTKQVNCEKAEVETAEMMPVNSTCTFNYAAQKSSDDEDEENTDDDNSEDDKEIYVEDENNDFLAGDL